MKGAAGRDGAAPAATRAAAARSSARTGGSARRASDYRRRLRRRRRRLTICAGPSSPRPSPRRAAPRSLRPVSRRPAVCLSPGGRSLETDAELSCKKILCGMNLPRSTCPTFQAPQTTKLIIRSIILCVPKHQISLKPCLSTKAKMCRCLSATTARNTPCHQTISILRSYICGFGTVTNFILCVAAFLVVLLLKMTTRHQNELPGSVLK
ncbi:uncharacterized protein LOC129202559 [Grus americana]|uniref:uncharacterized protein LOC129202559 n=1 Tax=Grus americana TaxID=9117 RepID=UPI00240821C1|nr:uncharacterized protein LOC129202559 [Grus americana]